MYTNHSDEAAVGLLDTEERISHRSSKQPPWLSDGKNAAIALLTAANLIWISVILTRAGTQNVDVGPTAQAVNHPEIAIVPALPRTPMRFHWDTPYSSPNDTQSGLLWDQIDTAHGGVAIPHSLAAEKQWQPSMSVPGDDSKGLYLLESYHQLHCLKIVRKLFLESLEGAPLSYPVQHARHCFDYFRQFIICHADNTPLYTTGDHTSGDGQLHMCNDWGALRDYATENSACFHDRIGNESLAEQFGQCDDGTDGIFVDRSR